MRERRSAGPYVDASNSLVATPQTSETRWESRRSIPLVGLADRFLGWRILHHHGVS